MNVDEIKATYSMRDIVRKYGFQPNRAGFIKCPFHSGDNSPSMKIYPKDFHCHACGANGDIFSFVQRMDDVDFKTAFLSLGGHYEKPTFQSKVNLYRQQKKRKMAAMNKAKIAEEKQFVSDLIELYRWGVRHSEPLSDVWCECYNKMQYQLYVFEELCRKEVEC